MKLRKNLPNKKFAPQRLFLRDFQKQNIVNIIYTNIYIYMRQYVGVFLIQSFFPVFAVYVCVFSASDNEYLFEIQVL